MICTSFSWPNMFDVSRSKVALYSNSQSLTNRIKLLLLSEPTELFMEPNFGVGLRKHMFKYNNDNVIALIQDELIEQLRLWEPGVIPEQTTVERGAAYSWDPYNLESVADRMNVLDLKITVHTIYNEELSFHISNDDLQGFV